MTTERKDFAPPTGEEAELIDPVMVAAAIAILIQVVAKLANKETAPESLLRQEAVDAANLAADAIELLRGLK